MDPGQVVDALWSNFESPPTGKAPEIQATTTQSPFFGQICGTHFTILSKMGKVWSSLLLHIAPVRQACAQQQAACIGWLA